MDWKRCDTADREIAVPARRRTLLGGVTALAPAAGLDGRDLAWLSADNQSPAKL